MKGTTKPMVKKTKVKQKSSPYSDKPVQKWGAITDKLLEIHPLKSEEIKDIVLKSWDDIFNSKIGSFKIGKELFPPFQIMSFMLHELIAHYIQKKHPKQFQVGKEKTEKDIHCITDVGLSIEIKASSDKSHVFANRSYAQPQTTKKAKNKDFFVRPIYLN